MLKVYAAVRTNILLNNSLYSAENIAEFPLEYYINLAMLHKNK